MISAKPLRSLRFAAALAGLALALVALGGCLVDSRYPIAPPDPAAADPDLLGTWGGGSENGAVFFHVFQPAGSVPGTVEIVAVAFEKDGSGSVDRYCGHLSRVGKARYINLVGPLADCKTASDEPFFFVLYDERPDGGLDVRLMREDAVVKAIGAGKLAGKKDAEGAPTSHITAEPEQIRAFLLAADTAALWDELIALRRVEPPSP
ncbi:MAG: hypothetical protein ACOY3L_02380 [Pseudomonadota bacterium]